MIDIVCGKGSYHVPSPNAAFASFLVSTPLRWLGRGYCPSSGRYSHELRFGAQPKPTPRIGGGCPYLADSAAANA